ncbi:hypothetical protein BLA24_25895 [Streptomyces cinnamoneus]|uniref:Uncharacterized protein n=1 Tax=Streptomyces cinnamoneus TaxID=53446 RepID=A0A2G1XE13_STRCJ|nr:DUF5403 family protein [Streptomyces cinnamoneus]PHQ49473.1 hypothetical protein BLA24_25895 [Streptomyces cinnamoneus]PPT14877.1 hypothetical protein CYQ11_20175 [Streptomyces cinnamoneus]
MAKVYQSVNGRKIEKYVAVNEGVQAELTARAFEIAVRAEEILVQHRADGHAEIDVEAGDNNRYVILSDDRGQKAALSIEYGRAESVIVRKDRDGGKYLDVLPAMDGLYILATASNLPKKRKGKVKLD